MCEVTSWSSPSGGAISRKVPLVLDLEFLYSNGWACLWLELLIIMSWGKLRSSRRLESREKNSWFKGSTWASSRYSSFLLPEAWPALKNSSKSLVPWFYFMSSSLWFSPATSWDIMETVFWRLAISRFLSCIMSSLFFFSSWSSVCNWLIFY